MARHPDDCHGKVWRHYSWELCSSPGTRLKNGVRWCGIHAPSAVARRSEARKAKSEKKMAAWDRASQIEYAKAEIIEAAVKLVPIRSFGQEFDALAAGVKKLNDLLGFSTEGTKTL